MNDTFSRKVLEISEKYEISPDFVIGSYSLKKYFDREIKNIEGRISVVANALKYGCSDFLGYPDFSVNFFEETGRYKQDIGPFTVFYPDKRCGGVLHQSVENLQKEKKLEKSNIFSRFLRKALKHEMPDYYNPKEGIIACMSKDGIRVKIASMKEIEGLPLVKRKLGEYCGFEAKTCKFATEHKDDTIFEIRQDEFLKFVYDRIKKEFEKHRADTTQIERELSIAEQENSSEKIFR